MIAHSLSEYQLPIDIADLAIPVYPQILSVSDAGPFTAAVHGPRDTAETLATAAIGNASPVQRQALAIRLREGLARAASRANSEPPSKRSATSCAGRMLTRATPSRTEC